MIRTRKTFDVFRTHCGIDVLSEFVGQVDARNVEQALQIAALVHAPSRYAELWVQEADERIAEVVDSPHRRTPQMV